MQKFILFFLFLTANLLIGQSKQQISGVVYEGNNSDNAIFFANVTLKETNQKMTTDYRGQYNFGNVLSGEYTLVFQFLGYQTITKKVIVKETPITLDAHLNRAELFILDQQQAALNSNKEKIENL